METEAKVIQCAERAGLILCGVDEYKEPEWMGTDTQWRKYTQYMKWVDEYGSYPWVTPF